MAECNQVSVRMIRLPPVLMVDGERILAAACNATDAALVPVTLSDSPLQGWSKSRSVREQRSAILPLRIPLRSHLLRVPNCLLLPFALVLAKQGLGQLLTLIVAPWANGLSCQAGNGRSLIALARAVFRRLSEMGKDIKALATLPAYDGCAWLLQAGAGQPCFSRTRPTAKHMSRSRGRRSPNLLPACLAGMPLTNCRNGSRKAALVFSVTSAATEARAVIGKLRRLPRELFSALGASGYARVSRAEVCNAHAANTLSLTRRTAHGRCGSSGSRWGDKFRLAADHAGDLNAPLPLKCGVTGVVAELVRVGLEPTGRAVKFVAALSAYSLHTSTLYTECNKPVAFLKGA